jgi:thiosulfate reductase cytochrome b subunit
MVLTGLLYAVSSLFTRHFQEHVFPTRADLSWREISRILANHLRLKRPDDRETWSYNVVQRLTYLFVIFVLSPLVIWTGLAMSPAIASVWPAVVTALSGQQSARTLHFFVSAFLVLFLLIHIAMVCLAGFSRRMRAMITGRVG